MKNLMSFIFLGILVMLSGCGSFGEPQVTYKTKVIAPEDILLVDCDISTPPNKNEYLNLSMSDKEGTLTNYSLSLIKNLSVCNKQMKALREWKKDSVSTIDTQTKH